MTNKLIRIILVDDHNLVRESWKLLLENNPRFEIIGDCDNGEMAIELTSLLKPDILLMDINMTPMNGFIVTENIMKTTPGTKIIGLSVNDNPKYATRMISSGARGYLTKTSPLEEINHAIEEVYDGKVYICKEVSSKGNFLSGTAGL